MGLGYSRDDLNNIRNGGVGAVKDARTRVRNPQTRGGYTDELWNDWDQQQTSTTPTGYGRTWNPAKQRFEVDTVSPAMKLYAEGRGRQMMVDAQVQADRISGVLNETTGRREGGIGNRNLDQITSGYWGKLNPARAEVNQLMPTYGETPGMADSWAGGAGMPGVPADLMSRRLSKGDVMRVPESGGAYQAWTQAQGTPQSGADRGLSVALGGTWRNQVGFDYPTDGPNAIDGTGMAKPNATSYMAPTSTAAEPTFTPPQPYIGMKPIVPAHDVPVGQQAWDQYVKPTSKDEELAAYETQLNDWAGTQRSKQQGMMDFANEQANPDIMPLTAWEKQAAVDELGWDPALAAAIFDPSVDLADRRTQMGLEQLPYDELLQGRNQDSWDENGMPYTEAKATATADERAYQDALDQQMSDEQEAAKEAWSQGVLQETDGAMNGNELAARANVSPDELTGIIRSPEYLTAYQALTAAFDAQDNDELSRIASDVFATDPALFRVLDAFLNLPNYDYTG